MKSARQLALDILLKNEKDKAYSTLALQETLRTSGADARDRALTTLLVSGVVERKLTLA